LRNIEKDIHTQRSRKRDGEKESIVCRQQKPTEIDIKTKIEKQGRSLNVSTEEVIQRQWCQYYRNKENRNTERKLDTKEHRISRR